MSKKDPELEEKRRFFARLDAIGRDDDEEVDEGLEESQAFLAAARAKPKRPRTAPGGTRVNKANTNSVRFEPEQSSGLKRTASAPDKLKGAKASHKPKASSFSTSKTTLSKENSSALSLSRSLSAIGPAANPSGRKRKREEAIKMVPEAQRIFKDKTFFFFPNNDANATRRLRIRKALEFGGARAEEWNDKITYVIVDKGANFTDLLKHLKLMKISPTIKVVNDTYIPECVRYHCVLDVDTAPFQVPGYKEVMAEASNGNTDKVSAISNPQQSSSTESSLALKPPGHGVLTRPAQTPSRTDESSIETHELPHIPKPKENIPTIKRAGNPTSEYNDALEEAINKTKAFQDITQPIEDIEEDGSTSQPPSTPASDSESDDEKAEKLGPKHQHMSYQEKFQCMGKHDGKEKEGESNPNAHTIEILEKMADYYNGMKDEWRIRAYRKAISTLRGQTKKIATKQEAMALPNIGERLAAKIEEIVLTSRLRRLDTVLADTTDEILRCFTKIYGVGAVQAAKWIDQGFRSLDDLREKATLTKNQQIGIDHYDDFNARIPRSEVEQLGAIVRNALRAIDPAFQALIMGSYRRGAQDSGDIDMLITKPHESFGAIRTVVLEQLVPNLVKSNFLRAELAATSRDTGTKWNGACALPFGGAPWRRIDLLLVPWDEMGAAQIYFTGNDIFNRSIRLLASTKGFRLNQHGLFKDVMRGRGRVKLTDGTLIESKSEKKIFEILGVPWRPPQHRIC
ncbi:hypothetical protein NA57DRAFT_45762 [Rhizodiscina lignyota]|uniref:DNA polymerase lambda n=1 Tax=Rhizodiscina lignyota TaxID=1504668 RepID=A0A9P4I427_9PEZI|nr:hypothetical protein NA57DRAFT_45762 [Rhizodiscina lignyota]